MLIQILTIEGANFSKSESIVMTGESSLRSKAGIFLLSCACLARVEVVDLAGVLSRQLTLASALLLARAFAAASSSARVMLAAAEA